MSTRENCVIFGIALIGGVIVAACSSSSSPVGPDTAVVAYSVADSGSITIDSLSYDNGHGVLVEEVSAGSGYIKTFNFALPGSVAGNLHAHGSGKVTYRVLWTIDGQTHGDSVSSTTTSANITVTLPDHSL